MQLVLIIKGRVTVAKCILMCFRYVKKFMMLILELTFVFHKSKQALTKATLKKLSTTIDSAEISLCFKEQFCDAVVTVHIRFRPYDSCLTIQAERNFPS